MNKVELTIKKFNLSEEMTTRTLMKSGLFNIRFTKTEILWGLSLGIENFKHPMENEVNKKNS